MELYNSSIGRARDAYKSAILPRRSVGKKRSTGVASRFVVIDKNVSKATKTSSKFNMPIEITYHSTPSAGGSNLVTSGSSARKLSASFERDARRYDKLL